MEIVFLYSLAPTFPPHNQKIPNVLLVSNRVCKCTWCYSETFRACGLIAHDILGSSGIDRSANEQ
jgi:hypothetical protein